MTTLLQINSSLYTAEGESSRLAARFVADWQRENPRGQVRLRDLAADPLPHLDAERFGAFNTPAGERSLRQQALVAESDRLIEEVRQADTLVIGLPMYNFGVPSTLKAWFDHIARAGVSFRYTATGPEGLLGDRRVVIFATRGGRYAETDSDHQTPFMRQILGFLGMKSVEFVYAEGLGSGGEARERSLAAARARIPALAA